jgi:hypothetical protein
MLVLVTKFNSSALAEVLVGENRRAGGNTLVSDEEPDQEVSAHRGITEFLWGELIAITGVGG